MKQQRQFDEEKPRHEGLPLLTTYFEIYECEDGTGIIMLCKTKALDGQKKLSKGVTIEAVTNDLSVFLNGNKKAQRRSEEGNEVKIEE